MKQPQIFSLLVIALFLSLSARGAENVADPDELAIYKILFSDQKTTVIVKPDPAAQPFKVGPNEVKGDADERARLKDKLPGLEDATLADYQRCKRSPISLTPKSDVGVKLVLTDQKTVDEIFPGRRTLEERVDLDECWEHFRERFSAPSLTYVSRVGFNPARTQAVVKMCHSSGSLSGAGWIILLELHEGNGGAAEFRRTLRGAGRWATNPVADATG